MVDSLLTTLRCPVGRASPPKNQSLQRTDKEAKFSGKDAAGIVMTWMGDDGARGPKKCSAHSTATAAKTKYRAGYVACRKEP
jgi:chemotaxis response regulator CheB